MKSSLLQELLLYRYRYVIGYALFIITLFSMLLIDIGSVPNGLSKAEMDSSVASNSLNVLAPRSGDVINLPYHLLQKASTSLLGVSAFSIRLPSLVLAVIAAAVMAVVLHRWFRRGVAMLALLIAATSVPFVSMGRIGTAGILYVLLLLTIMLGAVKLSTRARGTFIWKILVTVAALSLFYMPLGMYAVTALLIAGIFHPHVRYQIKRTRWWQFIVLAVLTAILMTPLVLASLADGQTPRVLFGIQAFSSLTWESLSGSMVTILKTLFLFHKPYVGDIVTPFLNLTFMLFSAFGLVRVLIDRHAARSYLLILWLAIALPLLVIYPSQFALLFVPLLFLMAIGIDTFIREWYRLFPRNPYARIGALVPLSLIALGLISVAASRYFYGYYYTDTRPTFHPEISAVHEVARPYLSTQLVVPNDQVAFYDLLRRTYPNMRVTGPGDTLAVQERIVLASSGATVRDVPKRIVTSHHADDAVLLRVYTPGR